MKMTTLLLSVLCLVAVYAVWKYLRFVKRHKAAMNVVLAKITFGRLSASKQTEVDLKAHEILAPLMRKPPEIFKTETHKFGWYALAMAELGIPPAVEQAKWNYVSNPFFAVFPGDSAFKLICEYMKRKHGIEVQLSDEPGAPWFIKSGV